MERTFEDGKAVGHWTTYDKAGQIHKVTLKKPDSR
jgi:hypothetical protein